MFQPETFDTDGVSVFNFEAQFSDFMKLDFNFWSKILILIGVSVFNFEAQFSDFMKLDFNFQSKTFDTDWCISF